MSAEPTAASITAALPASLTEKLADAAQSSLKASDAPGAMVGVRTPQGTWMAAYGVADLKTKTPVTTDMHVRIGSLTKTFTATLLMRAVQDGTLSLDDKIDGYVPGLASTDGVTLGQLATMTSGIPSYTFSDTFLDQYFGHPTTPFTPEQLVDVVRTEPSMFAPGSKFFYSNTNTVLLGMTLQKATGKTISDLLQQDILDPLKLTGTSFPAGPEIPSPHPRGYTLQGDPADDHTPTDATAWTPTFGWTAGQMISTLPDMLTWDRALTTGQGILSPDVAQQRLEAIPGPPKVAYGIGMGCIDGWVGHTGELPGFNSSVYYNTATDTSVVVLTNSDIASGTCSQSPTLSDSDEPCMAPAVRIFVALAQELGHPFHPIPMD